MRYLIWFVALLILLWIQTAVLSTLGIRPADLILVLVVVSILFAGFDFGLGLALAGGIMLDFLSGAPDGLFALTLIAVFLLAYFLMNNILAREPNLPILFSAVAGTTLGYYLLGIVFDRLLSFLHLGPAVSLSNLLIYNLPNSLVFNLLLAYPVLQYYRFVESIVKRYNRHETQPIRD